MWLQAADTLEQLEESMRENMDELDRMQRCGEIEGPEKTTSDNYELPGPFDTADIPF